MKGLLPKEPCSIETIRNVSSRHTICEELRKAYENVESGDYDGAKINIRISVTMAKAMSRKLKQYSKAACNDMFPKKEDRSGRR